MPQNCSAYLAQANIGQFRAPLDDPSMAGFVGAIDRLNSLAENSPGFIWRFNNENLGKDGENLDNPFGKETFVNMSVWKDYDSFKAFVYSGPHLEIMKRRHEWFVKQKGETLVLWWVPKTRVPDLFEASERLDYLQLNGSTPYAFNNKKRFSI